MALDQASPTEVNAGVAVLRWPDGAAEVERLVAFGVPRLLLVPEGVDPPVTGDCRQDWLRMPAEAADVDRRVAGLLRRAAAHRPAPTLDGAGRLVHRSRWVALSPAEERLAATLVRAFGQVVRYEVLVASAGADGGRSTAALRLQLMRLRRKLEGIGLHVHAIRGSGVLLDEAPPNLAG
ncbi:MAG TPA: winged helix-turn-helix domain-containing protein [Acidimicrobiales bacterium]|nr:winged helix-turn-helix domain-containing protein [Acidimicrobiales bacterium]